MSCPPTLPLRLPWVGFLSLWVCFCLVNRSPVLMAEGKRPWCLPHWHLKLPLSLACITSAHSSLTEPLGHTYPRWNSSTRLGKNWKYLERTVSDSCKHALCWRLGLHTAQRFGQALFWLLLQRGFWMLFAFKSVNLSKADCPPSFGLIQSVKGLNRIKSWPFPEQ